jgi:hypothetical protein
MHRRVSNDEAYDRSDGSQFIPGEWNDAAVFVLFIPKAVSSSSPRLFEDKKLVIIVHVALSTS